MINIIAHLYNLIFASISHKISISGSSRWSAGCLRCQSSPLYQNASDEGMEVFVMSKAMTIIEEVL